MELNDNKEQVKRCPKTGRIISEPVNVLKKFQGWRRWLFPIVGLASLIWFLIRVIPKPSRATYPCMRAVAPTAASFVTWFIGLIGFAAFIKKYKKYAKHAKYASAVAVVAIGILFTFIFSMGTTGYKTKAFTPPDAPNSPIGTAKGIFPGRVTWVRNQNATTWDGKNGFWWESQNTNQTLVDDMVSDSVRALTGQTDDTASWDAVFKYFNQNHNKGNTGYSEGEKIAIKINCNNTRDSHAQQINNINPSPQLILSLLRQLIQSAGVPEEDITIYDASRYITDNIYTYCKNEFPGVVFIDQNGGDGRIAKQWSAPVIDYSQQTYCGDRIPAVVAQADYLIDMPIMKAHPLAGMTLSAKNHYGTLNGLDHDLCRPYNTYNPFVDFMGDKDLGGKTLINILDGLYGSKHSDIVPEKWSSTPFNGAWPASIYMSLDQVALDSVGFDFINAEMGSRMMANSDSYLHEEALANDPPSGVVYAPDGVRLGSLGVHEHWNNAADKKYTRNLGTGNGIELTTIGESNISQAAAPVFSPSGGTYASAQRVTVSCPSAGAVIKYTTDGSTPTASSATYTGSLAISETTTLKAYAAVSGMTDSPVTSALYTIAPLVTDIPGRIEAEDYNAMDGIDTQGCSEGTLNIGWIDTGDWMDYDVEVQKAGTYTVEYRVASPNGTGQIQLKAGNEILDSVNVVNTGGWQNWQTVTGTVNLAAGPQTIRVYVNTGGWNFNWMNFTESTEEEPEPVEQAATPVITPATGTYESPQEVTITDLTPGAEIRYTTDGSTPAKTSGTLYTGEFTVSATTTVKAAAYKEGMDDSEVTVAVITITVPSGSDNLALNKPASESSHEAAFAAAGAFDGNMDTRWSSEFSDPQWLSVDLGSLKTINRVKLSWENAYARAYQIQILNNDGEWEDVYSTTTGDGQTDDISFEPVDTRYVRMYGTIRNTAYGYSLWEFEVYGAQEEASVVQTQESEPDVDKDSVHKNTESDGRTTAVTTGLTANLTTGLKKNFIGASVSAMDTLAVKAIPGRIEAESYDAMSDVATEACSEGGLNVGWIDTGDHMDYNVNVASTGIYTVNFRVSSPYASGQIQLRNGTDILASVPVPNTGGWQNWATVTVSVDLTAGSQTVSLYAVTGGFNVNWINFTSGAPVAQVAAPVFTPAGGTYQMAQNITISCATLGATIRYTTDGSTPTEESPVYTGSINIAATTSVKAIAIKAGMTDSEPAAAAYRITPEAGGAMDFQIQNGTGGTYSDSQIYWAVLGLNSDKQFCYLDANGNLVPISTALNDAAGHLTKNGQNYANIYHTINQLPVTSVPAISSGRMYLSIGSPCYIKTYDNGFAGPDINNPTDPNNDVYWDFVEFTLDAGGYHGNTTRVDAFGFPITHRLICADGYDRTVGETESRADLFAEYLNEVPDEFKTLVQAPYRIVAPCKGGFKTGGPYGDYFDRYVDQVWHEATAKPTTQDIFLGINAAADPAVCAALNRGVYMDPAHRGDGDYFYQITPSNFYSKFWHDHSIDGLSYGFCYDDVNNFAAYLEHNDPMSLIVTVGW
ncbi:MAG: beta-1,3-glucanase family protein [Anaerocolumna sp.]